MTFDDFFKIFFLVIAAFIVFVLINMWLMKRRWAAEDRMRKERLDTARRTGAKVETAEPGKGSTTPDGATHSTFGTSGIGASDVAVAGMYGTAGAAFGHPAGSDSTESSDCGDTGGDYGGGDSGGGGWND